jgi:hypothetical protein
MRNRLLALIAALAIAALASWTPRAEAIVYYCSEAFCEGQPETTACHCPPGTDREGSPSSCQNWQSIAKGGCWYE